MIKNQLTICCLIAAVLFAISSCKKHQAKPPNTFSAIIHDTVFNASIVSAITSKSSPEVLIIASVPQLNGDTDIFKFQWAARVQVNQPSDYTWNIYMDYFDSQNNFDYGMGSPLPGNATVMLTMIDSVHHRLAGTLSGMFYKELPWSYVDSLRITNGEFNVTYTFVPRRWLWCASYYFSYETGIAKCEAAFLLPRKPTCAHL